MCYKYTIHIYWLLLMRFTIHIFTFFCHPEASQKYVLEQFTFKICPEIRTFACWLGYVFLYQLFIFFSNKEQLFWNNFHLEQLLMSEINNWYKNIWSTCWKCKSWTSRQHLKVVKLSVILILRLKWIVLKKNVSLLFSVKPSKTTSFHQKTHWPS